MKQNRLNKIQQEKIKEFDKECMKYKMPFLKHIFSFLLVCCTVVPLSEYGKEDIELVYFYAIVTIWLAYSVLEPYLYTNEYLNFKTRGDTVWNVMKYLPVSRWDFLYTRMRYLVKYIWKPMVIGLAIQGMIAIGMKRIYIKNFLFIVGMMLLLPLIWGILIVFETTMRSSSRRA